MVTVIDDDGCRYGKNASEECDMRVGLESGETTRLIYTHTHRYLCALMDFWCQFAELHDLINKSRQEKVGRMTGDTVVYRTPLSLRWNKEEEQEYYLISSCPVWWILLFQGVIKMRGHWYCLPKVSQSIVS